MRADVERVRAAGPEALAAQYRAAKARRGDAAEPLRYGAAAPAGNLWCCYDVLSVVSAMAGWPAD